MDFDKIYQLYFKDIYYFILSLSGNVTIAEDVTSDSFFKALKNIDNLRKEESLKSYLFSIAKNTLYDYLRNNRLEIEQIEGLDLIDEGPLIEDSLVINEERAKLRLAIKQLKEPEQSVVRLRIYSDLSFKEIGNYFNKSDNWACVTFHRAKKKLRKFMEDEDEKL